jgi:hypothetical protein
MSQERREPVKEQRAEAAHLALLPDVLTGDLQLIKEGRMDLTGINRGFVKCHKIARYSTMTRGIHASKFREYTGFAIQRRLALAMPAISRIDVVGYLASLTVLATFCIDTFVSLRIVAIVSNVLFGIYGIGEHIYPVFFLHAVLLPINILKLVRLQPPTRATKLTFQAAKRPEVVAPRPTKFVATGPMHDT